MGCSSSSHADPASSSHAEDRFKGRRRMSQMSIRMGYFMHTDQAKAMLEKFSAIMMLPWEHHRAMGLVQSANPLATQYTFFSHQWECPEHPFPDLKQLSEHMHMIVTEHLWCDWYCVPQWSRSTKLSLPDPLATMIFQTTMNSFHRLCTHASDTLAVVKRSTSTLKMRGFDKTLGWQIDLELLSSAADADRQLKANELQPFAATASKVGIDLEYGVRAWCALERCYLPAGPHKDARVVVLLPVVQRLETAALKHKGELARAEAKQKKPSGQTEDDDAFASPLALLLNVVERLKGLIDLCQPSETNRALYMNAWSYCYLKRCVLSITNPADYKHLDGLMVVETSLGSYGNLYLQAVANDDEPVLSALKSLADRPQVLVEPRVHWPAGHGMACLRLDELIGLGGQHQTAATANNQSQARVGDVAESFNGVRLAKVVAVDLEKKRATVSVSDAGLLGATPHVIRLEVRWQGSRTSITAVIVRTKEQRQWTLGDRILHSKERDLLRMAETLKRSGLMK